MQENSYLLKNAKFNICSSSETYGKDYISAFVKDVTVNKKNTCIPEKYVYVKNIHLY